MHVFLSRSMLYAWREAEMGNEKKLKIVKWTAGLDRSVIVNVEQLYPAFGDDLSDFL